LYLLEDSEWYNNHLKSNTFSISDVRNMLLYKSKKMFLVTKNFLYYISRPQNIDWKTEVVKLEKMIFELDKLANEEIESLVVIENINLDEANLEKSQYIWLYLSNIYEFEYKRKIIK